jgi:ABC-type glycerol-3-phosphate transport system substrate-binding protein
MKSPFQTILIGVFIAAFIGAILIFSGVIPVKSSSSTAAVTGSVVVWGIYPSEFMQSYLDQLNIANKDISISYVQKNIANIQNDLVTAIADGRSPDIVFSDANTIFSIKDRLYTIPFTTYNERSFRDSFIDGASIFLSKDGVLAIPLLTDPLVVYYNKDILAGKNYVVPPNTWTGLVQSLPNFVKKDVRGTVTQTAIGLGESINVDHFKAILSALFLQTGSAIVALDPYTGRYEQRLSISSQQGDGELGSVKALNFYTSFANQTGSTFSWSRSLPSTLDMFLAGKSAFYIGFASELFAIQSRNPNLSFDVTGLFQVDGAVRPITYGDFSGLGIVKSTRNFPATYSVAGTLTSKEFIEYLSSSMSLPSARRDLLLTPQTNPYVQVYFKAALSTFSWPDTNASLSEKIFRDMIQTVNSGRSDAASAVYQAGNDLGSSLK